MRMKYWRKPLKFKKVNLDPRLFFSQYQILETVSICKIGLGARL